MNAAKAKITPVELNCRQAAQFCVAVIQANRAARGRGSDLNTVPLMIGRPGSGKTAIARQIAQKLGYDGTVVVTPTIYTIFDLRGMPVVTGQVENKSLSTIFAASNVLPKSGKWLILVDELADIPLHEQSGFYQLFLERRVGDYFLPDDCDVIGATNDETHGACANPLSSAIKTRVAACYVRSDLDQTVKYASNNGWHPRVIAFIRAQPEVLDGFDSADFAGGATPRGLEQLSNLEHSQLPADDSVVTALCQGHIGLDFGTRYATFRSLEVPDVQLVWDNPQTAPIPEAIDKRFLYAAMIAADCDVARDGIEKFRALMTYSKRLDRVDAIGLTLDVVRRNQEALKGRKDYTDWVLEYGDLL